MKLKQVIDSIERGTYRLVVLDALYRFLPPGVSENDNAAIMTLYNRIDGYALALDAGWVNIHHASKGDQAGKSTTDVGSGAGSQSRAADCHLVLRQHEQDGIAVVEAAVRSYPPVERFAIRWSYPIWELADDMDASKLRRRGREAADYLAEDRQTIVNTMVKLGRPEPASFIRDCAKLNTQRFAKPWASLILDRMVGPGEKVRKGNNQWYDTFILLPQDGEQ